MDRQTRTRYCVTWGHRHFGILVRYARSTRSFARGPPDLGQTSGAIMSRLEAGDRLRRRCLLVTEGPRAGLPSQTLRPGFSGAFGKGSGLLFPAALELVDLHAQLLMAGRKLPHPPLQLGILALQRSYPYKQIFSIQQGEGFGRSHGLQYSPHREITSPAANQLRFHQDTSWTTYLQSKTTPITGRILGD
jgi:hypothetical protein